MKIIFEPRLSKTNKYVEIMVDVLRKGGYEVYSLKSFFTRPDLWFKVSIIHLNWFENLVGDSRSALWRQYLKQRMKLYVLHLLRKKIIWTMHNRTSHEQSRDGNYFEKKLLTRLVKQSDAIVIHSKISAEILEKEYKFNADKICYCPHPNYIHQYGKIIRDKDKGLDGKEAGLKNLELLFLGAIRPYKNLELLMESLREINMPAIRLTIAGQPFENSYAEELTSKLAGAVNVKTKFRFIADEELPDLLSACDLLILPYDIRSSLNSGMIYLAFSYQKTVIAPLIGSVDDLGNLKESVFYYTYENCQEHKMMLVRMLEHAYRLHIEDSGELVERGKRLFEHMRVFHNDQQVFDVLDAVYRAACRE